MAHLHLAELDEGFINEHVQNARVGEVNQRGEEGGTGHGLVAARCQHRQRIGQDGAAHAKTQRVDLLGTGDVLHYVDGGHGAIFHVVVPGLMGQAVVGVAPAHHKGAVALFDGVADQRVLGLQVEDVELVDAGRHQQKWPLIHLGREGLVFEQLKQLVLVHHRAFGSGHVAAHLEQAFVGHRHMALRDVVQQVLHALGNALALGFDGFLLRFGIEGEEVAGCHGGHPLLHAKSDAGLGLLVGLYRLGQAHQRAGVEQVGGGRKRRHGVAGPALARKALVLDLGSALQALCPKGLGFLEVLLLQRLELGLRQLQRRCRRYLRAQVQFLKRLQRLRPALPENLLELLGAHGPG